MHTERKKSMILFFAWPWTSSGFSSNLSISSSITIAQYVLIAMKQNKYSKYGRNTLVIMRGWYWSQIKLINTLTDFWMKSLDWALSASKLIMCSTLFPINIQSKSMASTLTLFIIESSSILGFISQVLSSYLDFVPFVRMSMYWSVFNYYIFSENAVRSMYLPTSSTIIWGEIIEVWQSKIISFISEGHGINWADSMSGET